MSIHFGRSGSNELPQPEPRRGAMHCCREIWLGPTNARRIVYSRVGGIPLLGAVPIRDKAMMAPPSADKHAMTYTCDVCKGEFEAAWTDEEAMSAFRRAYPSYPFMKSSVVCDDCHKAMLNYTRSRSR